MSLQEKEKHWRIWLIFTNLIILTIIWKSLQNVSPVKTSFNSENSIYSNQKYYINQQKSFLNSTIIKRVAADSGGGKKILLTRRENPSIFEMLSSAAKYAQLSYCLLKKDTVGIDSGIKAKIEIKNEEINYYFNVLQLSRQDYYEREPVLQAFYTNDPSLIDSEFISWRLASTTVLNALREAVITIQTSGIFRPKINLIGHGVSGVYAVLAAKELSETSIKAEIRVFTFGQPKIGDVEFAKSINRLTRKNLQVFRVTNGNDFLPRLPLIGGDIELVHHIEEYWISEDCDCAGQDRIYKCEGTILNERTGEITENKECNNSFMSLGLMESHNGPYLGYEMGRCPV